MERSGQQPAVGLRRGQDEEGWTLANSGPPATSGLSVIPEQVSFQHEVYPEEPMAYPAPGQEVEERPLSRQVLIVQELEVRDRLASSQINKFLHLHTSERLPRRTHSHMVGGRAGREGAAEAEAVAAGWAPTAGPLPSAHHQSAARGPYHHPGRPRVLSAHLIDAPAAQCGPGEWAGGHGGGRDTWAPSPGLLTLLPLSSLQDALFFLKDFFTSLAAGINPVAPGEASEGEGMGRGGQVPCQPGHVSYLTPLPP